MKALITGASHGIGLAIANKLKESNIEVFSCSRGTYNTDDIKCDIKKDEDLNKLFKLVPEVDILILNAGGAGRSGTDNWLETSFETFNLVHNLNVHSGFKLIQNYLPKMIENKFGRIIAIASRLGTEVENGARPQFVSAKAAQIAMMKSYSKNKTYIRNGITFNTVSPGAVFIPDTGWDKLKQEQPEEYNKFCDSLPLGKMVTPEDVAEAVEFLINAKHINGINLKVDGGESNEI